MKKIIISLFIVCFITGCASKSVIKEIDTVATIENENSISKNMYSIEPIEGNYDLTILNIKLPANWHIDTSDKFQHNFIDGNNDVRGWVTAGKYESNSAFTEWQPNHSALVSEEQIETPLGDGKLFKLDVDNGTAASGITGTHDDYYAIIPEKGNMRYIFEFSHNDKKTETKEEFLNILKGLSFK